jgi:hypothetical protein
MSLNSLLYWERRIETAPSWDFVFLWWYDEYVGHLETLRGLNFVVVTAHFFWSGQRGAVSTAGRGKGATLRKRGGEIWNEWRES